MRARHAPRAGRPELGQVPELLHLLAHDVAKPVDVDAAVAEPAGLHVALRVHRRKHDLEPRPGSGVGAVAFPLAVMPAELAPEIEEDVVEGAHLKVSLYFLMTEGGRNRERPKANAYRSHRARSRRPLRPPHPSKWSHFPR